jgi:hypothetical protein
LNGEPPFGVIRIKPRLGTDGTMLNQIRAEAGAGFHGGKTFRVFQVCEKTN